MAAKYQTIPHLFFSEFRIVVAAKGFRSAFEKHKPGQQQYCVIVAPAS